MNSQNAIRVTVTAGPDRGRRCPLVEQELLLIGRGEQCGLQLTDPSVSRVHCRLLLSEGRITLEDVEPLGSAGQRSSCTRLPAADRGPAANRRQRTQAGVRQRQRRDPGPARAAAHEQCPRAKRPYCRTGSPCPAAASSTGRELRDSQPDRIAVHAISRRKPDLSVAHRDCLQGIRSASRTGRGTHDLLPAVNERRDRAEAVHPLSVRDDHAQPSESGAT